MVEGKLIAQAQQIKELHVSGTSDVRLVRLTDSTVATLKTRKATPYAFREEVEMYEVLERATNLFPSVLDVDIQKQQLLLSLCGFISAAKFVETCSDVWEPLTAELLTISCLRVLKEMHSCGVIHGRLEPHHLLLVSKVDARLSGLGRAHRSRARSLRREDIRQLGSTLVRVLAENCELKAEATLVPSLLRRYSERLGLLLSRMVERHAYPHLDCEELQAELERNNIPQPVQFSVPHYRDVNFEMGSLTKELALLSAQQPFQEAILLKRVQQLCQLFKQNHYVFVVQLAEGHKPCQGSCGRKLTNLQKLPCKHLFCENCLEAQLKTAVQHKVNLSHICCVKCQQTFDPLTLQLPAPLLTALDTLNIKQKFRHCPKCQAPLEGDYSANPQNLRCACGHKFCSYCEGKQHFFRCTLFYANTK